MPVVTPAFLRFNSTHAEAIQNNNTGFFSAAAYLHAQLPTLSTAGLTGYYSIQPLSTSTELGPMRFDFLIYSLSSSSSAVHTSLQPLMNKLSDSTGIRVSLNIEQSMSFEIFSATYLQAASVGTNYLAGSRLWDQQAVQNEEGVALALKAFQNQYLEGAFVSMPAVQNVPADQSSINPAWRRTVVHMSQWTSSIVFRA